MTAQSAKPPDTGFEFINTSFENASPLYWEVEADGSIQLYPVFDHERSSNNRSNNHWHFQIQARPGARLRFVFNNLENTYNGRKSSVARQESISVISENGRDWRPAPMKLLPGHRLQLEVEMPGAKLFVARVEPYRLSDLDRFLNVIRNIKADSGNGKRSKAIEGYCRQQSVEAGQKLDICVSTEPARRFTIEIYRMGYYGGAGARRIRTIGPMMGRPQPVPPVGERRLRECRWEPSVSLEIPSDWPSGIYVGKLVCVPETRNEHAWQNYVIFIVRDRRKADILYQASDNTWAAYNRWPDTWSLYTDPRGAWAFDVAVSFDRPCTKDPHIFNHPLSLGSGHFFLWEFPLVYWLEQHGYDITYASNSDMVDPAQIGRTKVFISSGHDEYWDLRQYENALASIRKGVTHLYLCGNAVMGVAPLTRSADGRPHRIITRKGLYGDYGNSGEVIKEPPLISGPPANKLMGAQSVSPFNGCGDWICAKPEHWIFEGTGMKKGDRIPGLVGHEYHGDPADIPGLEVVAEGDALHQGKQPVYWTSTIYPGPKKNFVFSASTVWWNQGLASPPGHVLQWYHGVRCHGPDPRVQRITRNLLRRALA